RAEREPPHRSKLRRTRASRATAHSAIRCRSTSRSRSPGAPATIASTSASTSTSRSANVVSGSRSILCTPRRISASRARSCCAPYRVENASDRKYTSMSVGPAKPIGHGSVASVSKYSVDIGACYQRPRQHAPCAPTNYAASRASALQFEDEDLRFGRQRAAGDRHLTLRLHGLRAHLFQEAVDRVKRRLLDVGFVVNRDYEPRLDQADRLRRRRRIQRFAATHRHEQHLDVAHLLDLIRR